jgi:hypothetical protein
MNAMFGAKISSDGRVNKPAQPAPHTKNPSMSIQNWLTDAKLQNEMKKG